LGFRFFFASISSSIRRGSGVNTQRSRSLSTFVHGGSVCFANE